jgi:release factor glutamine methyltransferase
VTIRQLVLAARARLVAAGIDANEAAMDAGLLARHALGWDQARLIAHETDAPPDAFEAAFEALVARRARREPISGITGLREFRGLEFEVTRDVLAPRPETEIVVEAALACLAGAAPRHVADVGTGSGCLAVCLALEFPGARVTATDTSEAALAVAARNARRHRVDGRIAFRRASMLDGVPAPVDLLASNPPYVPTGDIATLMPEVRDFEPREALDGGADGLDVIRALVAAAPAALGPGGWLIVEFGFGQADAVGDLVGRSALDLVRITNDLQGIPRTVIARNPR